MRSASIMDISHVSEMSILSHPVLVALAMGPCKCPGGEECKNPNLHSAYIARREGCRENARQATGSTLGVGLVAVSHMADLRQRQRRRHKVSWQLSTQRRVERKVQKLIQKMCAS